MSFWTSVTFARPDPPPVVTAGDLLRLADAVAATGVVDDARLHRVEIKFGRRVDRDRRDTVVVEQFHAYGYRIGNYAWDVDAGTPEAVAAVQGEFSVDRRQVYRAMLGFGTLARHISTALQTDRPDDGRANLVLDDVSIGVGVIGAGGLNDDPWQVGWVGVGIGGQSYLFPWTPADLHERIRRVPELRGVEAACRAAVPAPPRSTFARLNPLRHRTDARARRARRLLGTRPDESRRLGVGHQ